MGDLLGSLVRGSQKRTILCHWGWVVICMDFIEGLATSLGKNVIMVVVDRLSKYAHFISIVHPYIAGTVAKIFLDNIFLPTWVTKDNC
jgi:hypothetical protein